MMQSNPNQTTKWAHRVVALLLCMLATGTAPAWQDPPGNNSERYEALLAEARNKLEQGQVDKAVTFARQASRLDEQRFEAYFLSCVVLFKSEQFEDSRMFLIEAIQRAPAHQVETLEGFMTLVDEGAQLASTAEAVRLLVEVASAARDGNRHAQAARKYHEAWGLAPERPDFALRAAASYTAIEEFDQTAALYRELLDTDPMDEVRLRATRALDQLRPLLQESYDSQLAQGLASMELQELASALAYFEDAAKALPDEAQPHFHAGRAQAVLGNPEQAVACLGQAIARGFLSREVIASTMEYRALGTDPGFHKLLEDTFGSGWAAPLFQELRFEQQLQDIAASSDSGQWLQAWEQVREAYVAEGEFAQDRQPELAPLVIRVAENVARLYEQQGDLEQALSFFKTCLDWEPSNPKHLANRASVYLIKSDWDLALADFEAAAELDPENAEHALSQGLVMLWMNDKAQAQEHFAAVFTDPNSAWSLAWGLDTTLGWPHPIGSLEDVETAYGLAIEASSPRASLFNNRGVLRINRGATSEAVDDFEKAVGIASHEPLLLANLALAEHRLVDEGGRGFSMSSEDPGVARRDEIDKYRDVAQHYSNAAWRYATSSNGARRDGERAVELGTLAVQFSKHENSSHLDTLAAAYAELGLWKEATAYANQAVTMEPSGARRNRFQNRLDLYDRQQPFHEQ